MTPEDTCFLKVCTVLTEIRLTIRVIVEVLSLTKKSQ